MISGISDLGLVSSGFGGAKNDLIAELKLSHNFGGISKLRQEQQKLLEEQEKEKYQRFLAKFTMENFLEKVKNNKHISCVAMKKAERIVRKNCKNSRRFYQRILQKYITYIEIKYSYQRNN